MKYLFVGGPRSGQLHPVSFDRKVVTMMAQPQGVTDEKGLPIIGAPAVQVTYRRREMTAESEEGTTYTKVIYVMQGIPPEPATVMLAQILVARYVLGELHIDGEEDDEQEQGTDDLVPGGAGEGAGGVDEAPPGTQSGLYIPS